MTLTLRVVGGLSSEEIARAFLVPVPTVQARITRGKKTIAAAGVPFELPPAAEPWVWIPREISPGYHDEVVTACRRAGFSPDARHQANSIATQLAMVSCGIGVAIAPSLVTGTRSDLATRELRDPPPLVALSLLVPEDIDPLVEHFVTTVSKTLVDTPGEDHQPRGQPHK